MTQNASYDTCRRLIAEAYFEAGLIQEGQEPNSEKYARGLNRLNDIAGIWQTQGLKLWTNTDISITLTAGTATYTFGTAGTGSSTRMLKVIQGYYLDSDDLRRPLIPLSRQEYTLLSNTTDQGAINSYWHDPQQTLARVTFWLTPDTEAATGTAHLIVRNPIPYATSLTDLPSFPQEWYLGLLWALTDELCTGQPMSVQQRAASRASAYRSALEDWDVEQPDTRFEPDMTRGDYGSFS